MTSTSERPLVSVILPTFNRRQTIVRAIRSILTQDYEHFELLIVDDGSTDDTEALVTTIDDPRIRYIRLETNGGASRARNAGLREAKGELIAFQDSDDEWLYGKLSRQVEAIKASPSADAAVFHVKIIQGIDNELNYGPTLLSYVPLIDEDRSPEALIRRIRQGNIISPQTLMFSRSCLDTIGYFDECLASSVDWDFAIRLVHHAHVVFLDEPLVMTYTQENSISRMKRRGVRSQLRICLKLARNYDIDRKVLAQHFGRMGMALSKLGHPHRGKLLLRRSLMLAPLEAKNIARLAATESLAAIYPLTKAMGWTVWRGAYMAR